MAISEEEVPAYLGPPKFFREAALDHPEPGVATGLAWTPTGGDILFIEVLRMPGSGNLKLTGQLGEVMKESATAALSYIRARAPFLGIEEDFFEKSDLHIHVPAGAIPKDGPSAGVAMLCALVSLLSARPIKKDLAMTGEITLRGHVLPVGGIKNKVLAAHRAGIREIILPAQNQVDLEEIPPSVRQELSFHPVGAPGPGPGDRLPAAAIKGQKTENQIRPLGRKSHIEKTKIEVRQSLNLPAFAFSPLGGRGQGEGEGRRRLFATLTRPDRRPIIS